MNLAELKIYGFESIVDLLAAGIFSGEPVCLVGEKGTAKTFLCNQLANALDVNFIAYNASTINFEDVVGYPIPHKNADGTWDKMDFIPTKTSIWERQFVLIDELNRARIDRQNDLLQLIRNRAVQGMSVDSLVWVWAAVNPLSYEGTSAMDEAMADRFSWVIRIPSFVQIDQENRLKIINNITGDDMPGLEFWDSALKTTFENPEMDFKTFFQRVTDAYKEIKVEYNEQISEYVDQIIIQLSKNKEQQIFIDGRRAGMIKRNILSLAAVQKTKTGELNIEGAAATALFSSFPNELIGEPIKEIHLQAAHSIAKEYLSTLQARDLIKVMGITDDIKRVAAVFKYNLTPMDASNIIISYFNGLDKSWEKVAFSLALMPKILGKHEDKLTSDTLAQLATEVAKVVRAGRTNNSCRTYAQARSAIVEQEKKPFYQYVEMLPSFSGYRNTTTAPKAAQFLAKHMKVFKRI